MKPHLLPLISTFALLLVPGTRAMATEPIPIPPEEHGYQLFESMVISDEEAYEAFMREITEGQAIWNDMNGFLAALEKTEIDFDRDALVLVRLNEASGSTKVEPGDPKIEGNTLIVPITRTEPDGFGIAAMAYHGLAFKISKESVDEVEVRISGSKPFKLKVDAHEKSSESPAAETPSSDAGDPSQ